MSSESKDTKTRQETEEPEVYVVQKDLTGWKFSRRDFLVAASAATAAAVAGAATGCGPATTEVPAEEATPTATSAPPTNTSRPTATPTKAPTTTPTRTPTQTPTRMPTQTPTRTPTATPTPGLSAGFVRDVTIPDGSEMLPGQVFTKTWELRNNGSRPWGEGVNLRFVDGNKMGAIEAVPVSDTSPGETIQISVEMVAPTEPGSYQGQWRLQLPDGTPIGGTIWVSIAVPAATAIPTATPTPPGKAGEVAPGETGINFVGPSGETRTMPCGSPIPPGWTCTCNCVTAPPACTCVGHCSCDRMGGHYWYPC